MPARRACSRWKLPVGHDHAQAQARGYIPASQTLKNLHDYPVEEEQTVTLKDKRTVLLRPAVSSDAAEIRNLFHGMSVEECDRR